MIRDIICQRVDIVSVGGMRNKTGRFIDRNQIGIFIKNVELSFGRHRRLALLLRNKDTERFARLHFMTGINAFSVHRDAALAVFRAGDVMVHESPFLFQNIADAPAFIRILCGEEQFASALDIHHYLSL